MRKAESVYKCITLLALGALHGCGGGGGGGAAYVPPPQAAISPSSSAHDEAPAIDSTTTSGTTSVAGEPAPAPEPETAPAPTRCITAPQAGSTAEVGSGFEGVWKQRIPGGYYDGLMVVVPDGKAIGFDIGTDKRIVDHTFHGSFSFSEPDASWQITSGKASTDLSNWMSLSGSGSYTPKDGLSGTYVVGTDPQKTFGPWTYDASNSLAVSQALLEGTWGNESDFNGSIVVEADGTFTGSAPGNVVAGACALSGSVKLTEPGTAKNHLTATFSATGDAQPAAKPCSLYSYRSGIGAVMVNQTKRDGGACTQSKHLYIFLQDANGNVASIGFSR